MMNNMCCIKPLLFKDNVVPGFSDIPAYHNREMNPVRMFEGLVFEILSDG